MYLSRSVIEDFLPPIVGVTEDDIRRLLNLPDSFKILNRMDDFDTAGIKLRVESPLLPETRPEELIPEIELELITKGVVAIHIYRRTILREHVQTINLSQAS